MLKMTLESMILRNFQAHKSLKVQFGRITTVVGPTDAGKSAILRALRWACLNDFAGDDFIHEGEKECWVQIIGRDSRGDFCVTRTKSNKTNSYQLDNNQFFAFGKSGVPDPIRDILSLNEINFQGQHDSPFWLSESAPEVSRQLNWVVDLSIIDTSLSNIGSAVRKATERCELVKERLDGWKREQEELKPQQERINEFRALENIERKHREAEEDYDQLFSLLHRIDSNPAGEFQDQFQALEAVFEKARLWRNLSQDVSALQSVLERIGELEKVQAPPPMDELEEAHETYAEKVADVALLERLIEEVEASDSKHKSAIVAEMNARKRFEKETDGQVCPLCERKL